jgi:predicted ATPase
VLVSGEPGIGKSRLTRAFEDAIAAHPHVRLRLSCSPHHQDSALHPHVAQLERTAGFARGDADAVRLAKLDAALAQSGATEEEAALVAELLSIPTVRRHRIQQMTPQLRRDRTLAALVAQLTGLASRQPVLVVYEDLHWIDPSSRELLDRTIEQVGRLPALLVATFRPEFQPPWAGQPNVTFPRPGPA